MFMIVHFVVLVRDLSNVVVCCFFRGKDVSKLVCPTELEGVDLWTYGNALVGVFNDFLAHHRHVANGSVLRSRSARDVISG